MVLLGPMSKILVLTPLFMTFKMPNMPLKRDARNAGFDRCLVAPTRVPSVTVGGPGAP